MRPRWSAVVLGILTCLPLFAQPSISVLQNNYSYILPGLPNYGIAQGSIFVILGDRMGPPLLVSAPSFPLKTTLGDVTIAVTGSDGQTYQAIPYYVSATQSAAILPSATPVGSATIAVTYNGQTSAAAPLKVVQTAFGILTMTGDGSGAAAAFDVHSNFLGPNNAANPGDIVTLWGTGLGPAVGDETAIGGTTHDLDNLPITVLIGGQAGAVLYHGRSQYPGLDQINVTVPAGLTGCNVTVEVQRGNLSNFATIPVAAIGRVCTDPPVVYTYATVPVSNTTETRLYAGQQQFMTIVLDANNAMAIRPHPGLDVNGWGSSLYLEPFLPGATLHGVSVQCAAVTGGISVSVSGVVSQGSSGNYGTWTGNYVFSYNPGLAEITGSGTYNINLAGPLSSGTGDLNLYQLASNYLVNVPLLTGGAGNTGDMYELIVSGGTAPGFTWTPAQGSTYPQDNRNPLSVVAIGNYNQVDAAKQGYAAIAAAYKPTISVVLSCASPSQAAFTLVLGAAYDSTESQQYWQDNVGITPLVLHSSAATSYVCAVTFDSKAIAGDH